MVVKYCLMCHSGKASKMFYCTKCAKERVKEANRRYYLKRKGIPVNKNKKRCVLCKKIISSGFYCGDCYIENRKKYYKKRYRRDARYRKRVRASWLKHKYGITITLRNRMLRKQRGRCYICGKPETLKGRRLCVDHNQKTGKIRRLLCCSCNLVIGKLEKARAPIIKYINYLNNEG